MIKSVYQKLLKQHGHQNWWPARSNFEVMVGAILTQNTAWNNVEKAINNLTNENLLDPDAIVNIKPASLAKTIKPSGYFNIKAERLQAFCHWYLDKGGYEQLCNWSTKELRKELIGVYGVGSETADDILLYAFKRPIFVVDAYTRRIFSRLGFINGGERYDEVRVKFESKLPVDVKLYGEYHALIVQHGKDVCRPKPNCKQCCLKSICKN